MLSNIRLSEYKALAYRILLAYFFYFIARVLFFLYNASLLQINNFNYFSKLCYYGLAFDTTAILYTNLLFIVFSILPLLINTSKNYQKVLFYVYFTTNILSYGLNFIDFVYYKYTYARTTIVVLDLLKHETNKKVLLVSFLVDYFDVFALFLLCITLWIYFYKKVTISSVPIKNKFYYFGFSLLAFVAIIGLSIGGIRGGDFKKSTRPINLMDANRHVSNMVHADVVLNTPFAFYRTLFTNDFAKPNFPNLSQKQINALVQPIKKYGNKQKTKPNVVIFIVESYGKEYIGAFNKNSGIKNYISHTPFIDSLAQHSMLFTNAYANGRQSIHGMSSVLAGIPSFKTAFTSSVYSKQKIQSLVSTLKEEGYDTSFFHGAANGSMGFLGFANILGIDNYYGRTEFNNDKEFDGFWGIWDEPFLQFMKKKLDKKQKPFMATVFTVSSHEPYIVPNKFKNKFTEGGVPMHKCVEYTDYSLQQFFKEAKKMPWFENTLFVMVADHCNQVYYDEYKKPFNRYAIPILFYKPNSNLVGTNNQLAQQIDIYPSILDYIGYDKPFRSWGRSLFDNKQTEPFLINSTGKVYQFAKGNYICIFDGKVATAFYHKNDKKLINNLIKNRNAEMNQLELHCKAFITDYMHRVMDKKLNETNF